MYLPDGIKLVVTTQQEAEAICWEYCQNDDPDKRFCLDDGCPLAQTEIIKCEALVEDIDIAMRNIAIMQHNQCVMAAAVMSACT